MARGARSVRDAIGRPVILLLGGGMLGIDMTLWAESVHAVGAGVSTVLVNVQVVILPLLAFLVLGERVRRTFVLAVPVMLVGVALAGGLVGEGVSGPNPLRGTVTALMAACAYAGYILFVRLGAGEGQRFVPVAIATVGAALTSFVLGSSWQGVDLTPAPVALAWLALLAVVGQVIGWVLIASALPRLPSSTGASILLLQPVGAVLLAMLLLAERPAVLQLVGCAVVIGAVALAARTRAAPPAPPPSPTPRPEPEPVGTGASSPGGRRPVSFGLTTMGNVSDPTAPRPPRSARCCPTARGSTPSPSTTASSRSPAACSPTARRRSASTASSPATGRAPSCSSRPSRASSGRATASSACAAPACSPSATAQPTWLGDRPPG